MNVLLSIRAFVNSLTYRFILKPIIFLWKPEIAHNQLKTFGKLMSVNAFGRGVLHFLFYYKDPSLNTVVGVATLNRHKEMR